MMAPSQKETGGTAPRKSGSHFLRSSLSSLKQINTGIANLSAEDEDKKDKKKSAKRSSIFGLGPAASPDLLQDGIMSPVNSAGSNSPKLRPRTLHKGRPSSLFGSLGKKSVNIVDEGDEDDITGTTPESPPEGGPPMEHSGSNSKSILHHGEVQTTSGLFRKKKEYLVLTDTHLIRFKSQSRASETFHSIPPEHGRGNATRHPSTASVGSLQDIQSTNSRSSADGENRIPLEQILTAYKVEDGRPFFTTEVVYLDEEYHGVGSVQLMLHDPKEADLWHTSIRGAAQKARLLMAEPYPKRVVNYLVQALEAAQDYDADHFQVFRVVRRPAVPKSGRSSADDLVKLGSAVFYMVVGINRLHMISLPNFSESSARLFNPKGSISAFGLVTLISMNVQYGDDRFELAFRSPLQTTKLLELAASSPSDIAVAIHRACQFLKPLWLDYTYSFGGPRRLLEAVEAPVSLGEEDYGSFERTLVAYCMAYNCNPVNIVYAIDWDVEDAPEFRLHRPANTAKYSTYELLAIMRALRCNESFYSVSFRDIDLHSLYGIHDQYGADHVAWTSRSGLQIQKYFNIKPQERSLLYQEVQALALMSRRLRRMDFNSALPSRRPVESYDEEGKSDKDPGCEIVAALLPLCRGQLTSVTWIILSGIELGETDFDEIVPALNEPLSQIRAIECSRSGLDDRGVMLLLSHLERQNATLECINISDNPGRIHLARFGISMSRFTRIRKLDLSRITRVSGDKPLIAPEILLAWRLEELIINGIPVNEKTLDSIAAYLANDMSNSLRTLQMEQCNLNGSQVALLMRAMSRTTGVARDMQVQVSANRLEKGINEIVEAIEQNQTPSHLVMRMIEFTKEHHFKRLLEALRTNTTVRSLDISKASLPSDAGPETCDALRLLFAHNTTLEDFDISGEQAHLEVTRFGIGLNHALTGLKQNKTLRVLRIEYQNLGLEGANTLSSVLECNSGLTHVHCEHNNINLQGFTILVNAVANNFTVLELPYMKDDQSESMKRIAANIGDSGQRATNVYYNNHVKNSLRRTLSTLRSSKHAKADLTPQEVDTVVRVLQERWNSLNEKLFLFLERNRNIAAGVEGYDIDSGGMLSTEAMRPMTAMSDRKILEQVLNNATSKILGSSVDDHLSKESTDLNPSIGLGIAAGLGEDEMMRAKTEPKDGFIKSRSDLDGPALPELKILGGEKMFVLEDDGLFEMEN